MLGFLSVGIFTLLLAGIPVAVTLFLLAFGIDQFYSFFPLTKALGQNLHERLMTRLAGGASLRDTLTQVGSTI